MAYSGQAQEHFGKQWKEIVKYQTNHHLGGTNKDGSQQSSYIFQAAKNMMLKQHLRQLHPVPETDYMHKRLKKTNTNIGSSASNYKMVKAERFAISRVSLSDLKAVQSEKENGGI